MTIAWKFLDERSTGLFSRFAWPTPDTAASPGAWVVAGDVLPCSAGVHACRIDDLSWWMSAQLWEIELDGRIVDDDRKVVAERGRLTRRIEAWQSIGEELSVWTVWRVRDHVVSMLDALGDARAAELQGATTVAELAGVADRLGTGLDMPAGVGLAQIVDIVGDVPHPILTCHDAARAAGHCASAIDRSAATFTAAFAAERIEQSRWIARRLALA